MTTFELLLDVYHQLQKSKKCQRKGEFAKLLDVTPHYLSCAFAGDEKYLTPNLRSKLEALMEDLQKEQSDTPSSNQLFVKQATPAARDYSKYTKQALIDRILELERERENLYERIEELKGGVTTAPQHSVMAV